MNYISVTLKYNKNILYGGAAMKSISKMIVKVIDKTLQKEADNACIIFGYQPVMPKEVKKFKKEKLSVNQHEYSDRKNSKPINY